MADVGDEWIRLGEFVVAARVARGMPTRHDLAEAGGFSTRFLGDIERGRRDNYDPVYIALLEKALGWATGSVKAILAGGEPIEPPPTSGMPTTEDAEIELEIQMIEESDLPERQKREMIRFARQLQHRQQAERQALVERQRTERREQIRSVMDIARGGGAQPAT